MTSPQGSTAHHRQGLGQRPGGPLVPGLRRLCGAESRAADDAGPRRRAREDGVHQRHRLLEPLSLLHGELRLPHDPRPRAGGRDRRQARQPGARRVDHHRRRRRALDRRQPHDARAAPQPRLPDPAVQQRDLRPHQGPIFADQPRRHALALDSVRLGRPAGDALRLRARLGRAVHRPRHRRPQEFARRAQGRARPSRRQLRRNLPELHRLQRRRVRVLYREAGRAAEAAVAPGRREDAVRRRHEGHRARCRAAGAEGRRPATIPRSSPTIRRTASSPRC